MDEKESFGGDACPARVRVSAAYTPEAWLLPVFQVVYPHLWLVRGWRLAAGGEASVPEEPREGRGRRTRRGSLLSV